MSSFEKVNYNLRPNKSIERKMMLEAFSRLTYISHFDDYRYIGFGSAYFSDFILFHRYLGLQDMISIEKEKDKKPRFDFNLPYFGIEMKYGESTTILPNLGLEEKKSIIWLDYDDKLSDFMLSDIDTVVFNSKPGTFFTVSFSIEQDAKPADSDLTIKEYRLNEFKKRVGDHQLPIESMDLNFNTKNLGETSYKIISRQISSSLINRNGSSTTRISFKQLFNFRYRDNANIMTIGGLIVSPQLEKSLKKMNFENLSFIRGKEDSYKIECPNLTFREVKALDTALPSSLETNASGFKNERLRQIPLLQRDIKNYAKIYRYYPSFAETNM